MKTFRQIKFRECLLPFGIESVVFQTHIKIVKLKIYKTIILPLVLRWS